MASEGTKVSMYERAYFDVQKVLDEALGTEEEDGAGGGIAGDVWLLAERKRAAEERSHQLDVRLRSALNLLEEFSHPGACRHDHHGNCQEHGWSVGTPCLQKRIEHVLAAGSASVPGSSGEVQGG